MKRILFFALIAFGLISCEKKPTACLDIPDILLTNESVELISCSENYEYLTWDFGDNTIGQINDSPVHNFSREGKFTITLDAYAKGAYKSDQVQKTIISSYRYVDRVEIIGNSSYDKFKFIAGGYFDTPSQSADGVFTEDSPYLRIPPSDYKVEKDALLRLEGVIDDVAVPGYLINSTVKIKSDDDNPLVATENGFTMKVYWKYKSF